MTPIESVRDYFQVGWGTHIDVLPGWYPLVVKTHEAILAVDPDYRINQIKEKFGGMRYYIEGNGAAQDIAWAAEDESCGICERCGEPGTTSGKTWLKTMCEKHKVL